jgi:hypothetical protein
MNENFDLLKAHIEAFTRKDGAVVAAHDDKRVAAQAAVHPTVAHAVAAGARFRSGVAVFASKANAEARADLSDKQNAKGGAFVMTHPDHAHHVVVNGADAQRMAKNGYQHASRGGAR